MAGGYRPKFDGLAWVVTELKKLRRDLDQLSSAGTIRSATISGGSGLTVSKQGTARAVSANGSMAFETGALIYPPPLLSGDPQIGTVIRRSDGGEAFKCYAPTVGGQQSWALMDQNANQVITENATTGFGFTSPRVSHVVANILTASWPSSTAVTFATLWRADITVQQSGIEVMVGGITSTAATTGNIRVTVNGIQVGALVPVTSVVAWTLISGPIPASVQNWQGLTTVNVDVIRTAGAGDVACAVSRLSGT